MEDVACFTMWHVYILSYLIKTWHWEDFVKRSPWFCSVCNCGRGLVYIICTVYTVWSLCSAYSLISAPLFFLQKFRSCSMLKSCFSLVAQSWKYVFPFNDYCLVLFCSKTNKIHLRENIENISFSISEIKEQRTWKQVLIGGGEMSCPSFYSLNAGGAEKGLYGSLQDPHWWIRSFHIRKCIHSSINTDRINRIKIK